MPETTTDDISRRVDSEGRLTCGRYGAYYLPTPVYPSGRRALVACPDCGDAMSGVDSGETITYGEYWESLTARGLPVVYDPSFSVREFVTNTGRMYCFYCNRAGVTARRYPVRVPRSGAGDQVTCERCGSGLVPIGLGQEGDRFTYGEYWEALGARNLRQPLVSSGSNTPLPASTSSPDSVSVEVEATPAPPVVVPESVIHNLVYETRPLDGRPLFSRQQHDVIAGLLRARREIGCSCTESLAGELAILFGTDNSRFDAPRFFSEVRRS